MLYPYESRSREVKDISGVWRFKLDRDGVGMKERWYEKKLEGSIPMPVPASYNDITQEADVRDYVGEVWFEKTVTIPQSWKGRRIVLRFGSVTHFGRVWLNGDFLMVHKGGYLPFEAEINPEPGTEARITVMVSNVLDYQTLPPGEVEILDDPYKYERPIKVQRYFHDFFNYAGIHRPVKLYTTPQCYIRDITVNTDIDGETGVIRYQARGNEAGRLFVEVFDSNGQSVGRAEGEAGEIHIGQAELWEPLKPYLYQLNVYLEPEDGREADIYSMKVGIRTVKVAGKQFLINGKPFYFKGFGKHEDMDIKGKGLDLAMCVKDFNLMKWINANSLRTSHYPYAEEILDLADEYGFVVIDESPAVGMTFFNEDKKVFVEERVNRDTLKHHIEVMEELVARDKNHPCVVMWSVANEPSSWESGAVPYFESVIGAVRRADPGRPITMVSYAFPYGPRIDRVASMLDVVCINKYYSWYEDSGMLDVIDYQVKKELDLWHKVFEKPLIMTEYGADSIAGFHSCPPVMFTEEYQIEMVKRFNQAFDRLDFVIGEHLWAFSDFATKQGTTRVIGNRKGVFTRERNPKSIAFLLRDRWKKDFTTKTLDL